MIGSVRREQPRFERNERRGCRRAHCRRIGDARIRVETARHVEREDGNSARARAGYPLGVDTLGGPLEADAEKTVDDQPEIAALGPFG